MAIWQPAQRPLWHEAWVRTLACAVPGSTISCQMPAIPVVPQTNSVVGTNETPTRHVNGTCVDLQLRLESWQMSKNYEPEKLRDVYLHSK